MIFVQKIDSRELLYRHQECVKGLLAHKERYISQVSYEVVGSDFWVHVFLENIMELTLQELRWSSFYGVTYTSILEK